MPSLRPTKPRCSVVVALTLTASTGKPSSVASRSRMAGMCGASLGFWVMTVASTFTGFQPASAASCSTRESRFALSAPAKAGSSSGKCWPMSPSPAAPSNASQMA